VCEWKKIVALERKEKRGRRLDLSVKVDRYNPELRKHPGGGDGRGMKSGGAAHSILFILHSNRRRVAKRGRTTRKSRGRP